MVRYILIVTLLYVVAACTSERPFYTENLDYGKDQEVIGEMKRPAPAQQADVVDVPDQAEGTPSEKTENRPPRMSSVKFVPEVFHKGDRLGVVASGRDEDGDDVTLSYDWQVNGEPGGNTNTLDFPIQRGDQISLTIVPFDGHEYGRPITVEWEILNLPPMIVPHENGEYDGDTYMYQVKAEDPDGDRLAYSLKAAPEGMLITPTSGLIVWDVPGEFNGSAEFSVIVEDGHGGRANYDLSITLKTEEVAS
jgi:hypothetical protein